MYQLPEQFIENMKKQLPEQEWEAFFAVYENPPYKGVRLNPLKGTMSALTELLPTWNLSNLISTKVGMVCAAITMPLRRKKAENPSS